jgi:hypothetical protein
MSKENDKLTKEMLLDMLDNIPDGSVVSVMINQDHLHELSGSNGLFAASLSIDFGLNTERNSLTLISKESKRHEVI